MKFAEKREFQISGNLSLMASFLFVFDIYAVIPIIPHLKAVTLLQSAGLIPLFFATRNGFIAALILPSGRALDVFGASRIVGLACFLKAFGFYLLFTAEAPSLFLLAAALLGIGTAITRPAIRVLVAEYRSTGKGKLLFEKQNLMIAAATFMGPLTAQMAVSFSFLEFLMVSIVTVEAVLAVTFLLILAPNTRTSTDNSTIDDAWDVDTLRACFSLYLQQALLSVAMGMSIGLLLLNPALGENESSLRGLAYAFASFAAIMLQLIAIRAGGIRSVLFRFIGLSAAGVAAILIGKGTVLFIFTGLFLVGVAQVFVSPAIHDDVADKAVIRKGVAFGMLGLLGTISETVGSLVIVTFTYVDDLGETSGLAFLFFAGIAISVFSFFATFRWSVKNNKPIRSNK